MKSNKKWQKEFITNVFSKKQNNDSYCDVILKNMNLLDSKNMYLPNSLFKFYNASSENILDIRNKRLWLAQPSAFNDPFDCKIGFNKDEYEKKMIIEWIKRNNLYGEANNLKFSNYELKELNNSYVNKEEYLNAYARFESYSWTMSKIMGQKDESLQHEIWKIRNKFTEELEEKMDDIRKTNIRVACFSGLNSSNRYYESYKNHECLSKIQMWSHYANNHKGFCVEYDISSLKEKLEIKCSYPDFYNSKKNAYMYERLVAIIKGGLFPIMYTSKRVKIPFTKPKKYKSGNRSEIAETLYKAYITKSTDWSYENEWRLIIDEKIADYYMSKIPFPFIKKIFLGCNMDKSYKKDLLEIVKEMGIEVRMMKMESNRFDLEQGLIWHYGEWEEENRKFNNPY